MVQWKLVCGLAALCVVGSVKGSPMEEDDASKKPEDINLDCMVLGAVNFNGVGKELVHEAGMPSTVKCPPNKYIPETIGRRRLEETKSTDMMKLEAFFGTELETDFTKLSSRCARHPIPWPGGYWPSYGDSINQIWNNKTNISASEKYARGFGYDVKTFMDTVSAYRGVDYMMKRHKKPCNTRADCKDLHDKSLCGKRAGQHQGYCIPKWPGICHAWAPAAILEPEPICAVVHNGTRFEPFDIKALITMAYDGSKIPTIFTGRRFNGSDAALNGTDQYGRFLDDRRRDINPGYFHIAATNILCKFKYSFIIDISAGNEVWNQPVSSFEITRLSWMTPSDAAKKFWKVDKYPFNDAATNVAIISSRLTWVSETSEDGPIVHTSKMGKYMTSVEYRYLLELDDTYHIIGGEWLGNSTRNHPDFLWLPTKKPDDNLVTEVGVKYAEVKELLTKSVQGDCDLASTDMQKPATNGQANSGASPPASNESPTEAPPAANNAPSTTPPNSPAEPSPAGASPAGTPAPAAENDAPVATS